MLLRWLWAAAFLMVIVGSLLPADSLPIRALSHFGVGDKLQHFAAYAVLAFLPTLHERWPALAAALAAVVGTGVLLEFAQNYSPGRSFEFGDMVADTVGALCGLALGLPLRA
jgi:VanZ family protein